MRSTIHLVSARDCLALRDLVQPAIGRPSRHSAARRAAGIDDDELARAGRALMDAEPRTFRELGALLRERWPACDADALAMGVRETVPLVQIPPRGLWHRGGVPSHAAAETWLSGIEASQISMADLVRRYLAAYGPASVLDAQTFTGLTGLREVFDGLRPELRMYHDENGGELFDLGDAPRPMGRTRAPVRFLPEFDNLVLAHADRRRLIADEHRGALVTRNLRVRATFLWQGMVAGTWEAQRTRGAATLTMAPFRPLPSAAAKALTAEAEALLRFAQDDAASFSVQITQA